MTEAQDTLTSKQWLVKITLLMVVLMPGFLVAAFWRESTLGQHYGAVATLTILVSSLVSISSRTWIGKLI